MQLSLQKVLWFGTALALAWGVNTWRQGVAASSLEAAHAGDRSAAERWVERALREAQCDMHEARDYLSSTARQYVRRADYVEGFVDKLYAAGAPQVDVCDSTVLGVRLARYLVVLLPDDPRQQEQVIADAQSLVRRDAVVYRGVTSSEVEELVRRSTLVGKQRVLVDLPAEAL